MPLTFKWKLRVCEQKNRDSTTDPIVVSHPLLTRRVWTSTVLLISVFCCVPESNPGEPPLSTRPPEVRELRSTTPCRPGLLLPQKELQRTYGTFLRREPPLGYVQLGVHFKRDLSPEQLSKPLTTRTSFPSSSYLTTHLRPRTRPLNPVSTVGYLPVSDTSTGPRYRVRILRL